MPTRPDRFPILQARPAHDLINRLTQAQKELAAIHLSRQQKQDLDRWVVSEFACAVLRLEGVSLSQGRVESVLAGSAIAAENAEDNSEIVSMIGALSAISSLVEANGRAASLTPALLIKLNSSSDEAELSQKDRAGAQAPLEAAAAMRLAKLESVCHWFSAESFAELHPAEQSSIVLMRLIELAPFDHGNTRTALAAASLFTLRSGLPPIIITPEMEVAYRAALNDGLRMNTKPMVDLLTEALLRTLSEMIERLRGK